MIRSMTGFGAAATEVDGARYASEVRSLNSKYFKALIRLPDDLQGLEAELEAAIARRLTRGSIVLTVRYSDTSESAAAEINAAALNRYVEQIRHAVRPGTDSTIDVSSLLQLPGVVIPGTGEELLERARPVLLELVGEACGRVLAMRRREGTVLHEELHRHCRQIGERLERIAIRSPEVIKLYRRRLKERMDALLAEFSSGIREEDLIREVAVYAERSDITEEVARLQGHLAQFAEIIDAGHDRPLGRTLDFLSQEMLREANTIASKCLDVQISREIVEIKGDIDRIKEQVQNVE